MARSAPSYRSTVGCLLSAFVFVKRHLIYICESRISIGTISQFSTFRMPLCQSIVRRDHRSVVENEVNSVLW